MNFEEIKKLYQQSESEKNYIIGQYTEAARYTMPYMEVYNDNTKTVSKKINKILSVVLESSLELKNLIMNTMLSSGAEWASLELDKDTFEQVSLEIPQITRSQYNDLNAKLDDYSTKQFKMLADSNFYNAASKAVVECQNLGTGCIALIENDSLINPFSFMYIPINAMFFTEDALGRPAHTFRRFANITSENVEEIFGITYEKELPKGFLVESCIKDGNRYRRILSNEDFTEIIYDEEQDYPAHIVFRWDTSLSNSYGVGIGMYMIDEFRDLEKYKGLLKESAELLVNPPLGYFGSIEFMRKMSFTAGSVSFLGNDKDTGQVAPLGLGTQLIPIENEIMKIEQTIRDAYIAQPLGTYTDRGSVSATEVNVRYEMFRNKFSGVYENLSDELLKTVFLSVFKLLVKKRIFTFDEEYLGMLELRYQNEMTKQLDIKKASDLLKFKNIGDTQFPIESKFMIDSMSILEDVGELMGINGKHVKPQEEATESYVKYMEGIANANAGAGENTEPTG